MTLILWLILWSLGYLASVAIAYHLGRLRERVELPEDVRPADWAVSMAENDPLRLVNLLRRARR